MPGFGHGIEKRLEAGEAADVLWRRAALTIEDVLAADELFLTNSSWGVMPVVRVERHTVGAGVPGPVARAMREKWLA